jgi:hypothetical protein
MSAYEPQIAELVDSLGTQSTRRGKQNHYYYILGMTALPEDDPRFAWLYLCKTQGVASPRATILSELGRIGQVYDKETVFDLALTICEKKLTTRKAMRLLKQWRGVKRPASEVGAALAIRTAVNNYFKTHPDTTFEQMIDAMNVVLQALEESKPRKLLAA